ncbi:hypothetical protein GCM10022252_15490 [Streptosporangium oxazolinicum]|uniref:Uncharacterized protein n=1 Tax=Streptosporangium oxazolinicum TaxID=909287 RepID=A0ABP8AK32_9ACTN
MEARTRRRRTAGVSTSLVPTGGSPYAAAPRVVMGGPFAPSWPHEPPYETPRRPSSPTGLRLPSPCPYAPVRRFTPVWTPARPPPAAGCPAVAPAVARVTTRVLGAHLPSPDL